MADTLVIIPAYNEASRVGEVIAGVRRALADADVLVIDDGSRDTTAVVAAAAGARVISLFCNMGYGVAIQTGYKYAERNGYRYLAQIDGDGQHDPSGIPSLLEVVRAGQSDFAIGSRFLCRDSYTPSLARRLGMAFFRYIVSLVIRQRISDTTSGYQAFNREVLRFLCSDMFPYDYPDADILITLHLAGFTIREVPVHMFANAEGKTMHSGLMPVYYVIKMLLSIFVVLLRSRKFYRRERQ